MNVCYQSWRKPATGWLWFGLLLVSGCGGGGSATTPGLPDPGLTNVETEDPAAREASIGIAGGTIEVEGSNGATYTLTIPPGALQSATTIGVYPVASIATLPSGAPLIGAVHFVPAGLTFDVPAQLAVDLPSGVTATEVLGLGYAGDGSDLGFELSFIEGNTITMPVLHFSGKALAGRTIEQLIPEATGTGTRADILDNMVRIRERQTGQEQIERFSTLLKNWYLLLVDPAFDRIPRTDGFPSRPFNTTIGMIVSDPAREYDQWLDGILYASQVTGQPQSVFAPPEQAEGEAAAIEMLGDLYQASMEFCKDDAVANPASPMDQVGIATRAHMLVAGFADLWGVPRTSATGNRLSDEALRADSCIQCVITGPQINAPLQGVANAGLLAFGAGFTIDGGPVRTDLPIFGRVFTRHDLGVLFDRRLNGTERPQVRFTWPNNVTPMVIELGVGIETPAVPVFARITKSQVFTLGACSDIVVNTVDPTGIIGFQGQETIFFFDAVGSFDQILWDFGGGATTSQSTSSTPSAVLGAPGTYTGTLKLTNTSAGCTKEHAFEFTVRELPTPRIDDLRYVGIIDDLSITNDFHCIGPAKARFEYRSPLAGGQDVFLIEYQFDCLDRPPGQYTRIFLFEEENVFQNSFITKDGLGSGALSDEGFSFTWLDTTGNHVQFGGTVDDD